MPKALRPELPLRTSLMLLMVLAAALTFFLVGGLILWLRLPQVETRAREQLQQRAQSTARLLELDMAGIEAQLRPSAHLLRAYPAQASEPVLQALTQADSPFVAVFLLDPLGRVQSLGLRKDPSGQAARELSGADFSANPLFRDLQADTARRPGASVLWSDKYLSALAGTAAVAMAMPVDHRVLIAELDPARMLTKLEGATRDAESEVLIIDGRGQWLASTRGDTSETERHLNYANLASVQALLHGQPPPLHEQLGGSKLLVGAVRPSALGWTIIASAPSGWGQYSYRVTVLLVIGGFGGALLISLLLAPLWATRFTRPVRALIARAHAVAEGDYASPWPARGTIRELNQLGTDLSRMVHTIQTHGERLRATLDSAPAVSVQWYSREGRPLYWNKASEAMYGYSAEQALSASVREQPLMYRDAAQVEQFLAVLDEIARTGQAFGPAEFTLRHREGHDVIVLASLFAIPGEQGEPVFVCMDIDISAAKRAEATLRTSERKLDAVFNASPAPMSVSDADNGFRLLAANKAWERQFRRERSQVLGLNGAEMGLWAHAADRQRLLEALAGDSEVHGLEAELLTGDGQALLCRIDASIKDIGGERLLLMMATDITEQRRNEQEVRQLNSRLEARVAERTEALSSANEELQTTVEYLKATQKQLVRAEKLAALGRLVAGVAHELNTPLGNGLMAISTLRDKLKSMQHEFTGGSLRRSTLDDFLQHAQQGSDITERNLRRAAELVASFKQVAVDQTSSLRREFALDEVVNEVLLVLSPTTRKTPHQLRCQLAPNLRLDSYPGALVQVLGNLIENALIHAFDAAHPGEILIEARADGPGRVCLSVTDNGCGIADEHLGRIFDPFFTTRLGQGGSGLGLHVVHELVCNVLGGAIRTESRVGQGTRFELELPLVAPLQRPGSTH